VYKQTCETEVILMEFTSYNRVPILLKSFRVCLGRVWFKTIE